MQPLQSSDLGLLATLDALLQESSVSHAGRRLGLSTPATSHALARLRGRLDDPLLVRAGRRMMLTPRAEQLKLRFVPSLVWHPRFDADPAHRWLRDQKIQPFWIEEEAREIEGTNFVVDQAFRPFAVRDGLLVTGQQQFSGGRAAELVIEALGR